MKLKPLLWGIVAGLTLSSGLIATTVLAQAKRPEAKIEREHFTSDYVWNDADAVYERRDGSDQEMRDPKTRAQVKAERDAYLAKHRWDESAERFVENGSEPRDVSKMTREQVRAETAEFMRLHHWDRDASRFVARPGANDQ